MLPSPIREIIEAKLKINIQSILPLSGGSINEAFLLQSREGAFFLKYNSGDFAAQLFKTEVLGLDLLRKSNKVKIPQIFLQENTPGYSFLVMEYIDSGEKHSPFWENFGEALAHLHRINAPRFGLDHDTFIGRLPQSNQYQDNWEDFYRTQRLLPQIKMALDSGKITATDVNAFERLFKRFSGIFPKETPALLHGDLWSGNFLATHNGLPVLIDPAVCFAHREMDLAMTYLFGGFSPLFYEAYQENYPLAPGFEQRVDYYQLYYLMVHVNLFGGSYVEQVRQILKVF